MDTLYYGTFTKASTASAESDKSNFVYCPGPKAVLKLVENEDNLADLSQQLLDEKLVAVNTAAVAEDCGAPVETVNGLLAGIRDEIVDLVITRKHNVQLNIGLGSLSLRHTGTVEFKSSGAAAQAQAEDFDRLPDDYDRFSNSVMSRTHT